MLPAKGTVRSVLSQGRTGEAHWRGDKINLIHVANNVRGFWISVPVLVSAPRIEDILGGYVVQTDAEAPRRGEE